MAEPRLKEKVAVISGGGTGIGQTIAEAFSQQGSNVIILGRTRKTLETTAQKTHGVYHVCDIRNESEIVETVEDIVDKYGGIDVLVNNAGVFADDSGLDEIKREVIEATLETNVTGTLLLSKHVYQAMISGHGGSIINITSVLATRGAAQTLAYTASKGAILAATRAMAAEGAQHGIRVNSISPSIVHTGMTAGLLQQYGLQSFVESHPLGRLAQPGDIAQAAIYLASEESSFVTGQNLVVDGGRSIKLS
jgi:NAD(P)-dependent dehydrogenase (short-subunit alcohol dehydrogenase family)